MQIQLHSHPAFPPGAVTDLYVDINLKGDLLSLSYVVQGDLDAIVIPSQRPPARADSLWQTTCFEAFLKQGGENGYREFNFSPSGEWGAYTFAGYREGMQRAPLPADPLISAQVAPWGALEVHVTVPVDRFSRALRRYVNLAAIVEEKNGQRSYWALAHPTGDPDFHHSDCFALQLPAAASE